MDNAIFCMNLAPTTQQHLRASPLTKTSLRARFWMQKRLGEINQLLHTAVKSTFLISQNAHSMLCETQCIPSTCNFIFFKPKPWDYESIFTVQSCTWHCTPTRIIVRLTLAARMPLWSDLLYTGGLRSTCSILHETRGVSVIWIYKLSVFPPLPELLLQEVALEITSNDVIFKIPSHKE